MTKARNLSLLSTVEVAATTDQTKADLNAIGVSGGRKNLIINGGFDVWQRGTSFTGAGYAADRWIISTSNNGLAVDKTASRDSYNTIKITMNGTSCALDQRLEGFGNVAYNKQFTVSFWVRGSGSFNGNTCRVRNHSTATNLESQTYNVTTSWLKVALTFAANNTWSKDDVCRLYVLNNTALVSGDWIEFSNVQLELGSVATDFEHRSYGEELQLCKRFFEVVCLAAGSIGASNAWTGGSYVPYKFAVEKRVTPSVSHTGAVYIFSGGQAHSSSTLSNGALGVISAELYVGGISYYGFCRSHTAIITADSEL